MKKKNELLTYISTKNNTELNELINSGAKSVEEKKSPFKWTRTETQNFDWKFDWKRR